MTKNNEMMELTKDEMMDISGGCASKSERISNIWNYIKSLLP